MLVAFFILLVFGEVNSLGAPNFQVIVNPQNEIRSLDRKFVTAVFLKKITHWPENGLIQPIDQNSDSPVRYDFSEEIMGRSVLGVKNYWQQMIFSGRNIPPPEVNTDEAVVQFIMKNSNAIGYVSSTFLAKHENSKSIKTVSVK